MCACGSVAGFCFICMDFYERVYFFSVLLIKNDIDFVSKQLFIYYQLLFLKLDRTS